MAIRIIQVISLFLGIFFVYKSYKMLREKNESMFYFTMWTGLGAVLIVLSIFYEFVVEFIIQFMGMSSKVNFLFSATSLFLLFIVFMIFKELENMKKKMNDLNREISIERVRKK